MGPRFRGDDSGVVYPSVLNSGQSKNKPIAPLK
jgi:hypothetical protein